MSTQLSQIVGSVVAGFPSPAEQYVEPPLDLNEHLVKRPAATYFVKAAGDSMVNAGINNGDLLVVDRSLTPTNGDVVIASVDGEFTVKTFRRKNGRISLVPANERYAPIDFSEGQELQIFGKVTYVIHKL